MAYVFAPSTGDTSGGMWRSLGPFTADSPDISRVRLIVIGNGMLEAWHHMLKVDFSWVYGCMENTLLATHVQHLMVCIRYALCLLVSPHLRLLFITGTISAFGTNL